MDTMSEFQDLGELQSKVRTTDGVGASGVAPLVPNDDVAHIDALEDVRGVIDECYGDRIDDLAGDDQEVVIERVVFRSDELPYIEYQLISDEVQ